MKQILDQLEVVRRRSRTLLVMQNTVQVCAWLIGGVLLLVIVDYLLRLPSGLRFMLLVAGCGGLVWAFSRHVSASLKFHPSLTQVALRVERSEPGLAGRLASSVEFAATGMDRTSALAARSVRDTEARLAGHSLMRIIRAGPAWKQAGLFAAVVIAAAAIAMTQPSFASTGLQRLFLPYGQAKWPARTAVQSLMHEVLVQPGIHPRGQALALRAKNMTRRGESERVDAQYRVRTDGSFGSWETIILTHQGGGVHERLVDTNAQKIEVSFHTADARTEVESIELVPPPAVLRATLEVSPPPYASGRVQGQSWELGPGTDDRAGTTEPSLSGSWARLTVEMNKQLPVPTGEVELAAWRDRTFDWGEAILPEFRIDPALDRRWLVSWQLDETRVLIMHLEDEHGLHNEEPIAYRVDVVRDTQPEVTVTQPESDGVILTTAVVNVRSEARDDVAISRIAIEAAVQKRGDNAPADPPAWMRLQSVDTPVASIDGELDLGPLNLERGDVLHITGVAQDIYEVDGRSRQPARSLPRRLRVIDAIDFASQLRQQLGAVRQNAIRIEALQAELQDDVTADGVQPGIERAQAQLGDRIAAQAEQIATLQRLLEMNRLNDDPLRDLLSQSRDLLVFAGRAASRATAEIERRQHERNLDSSERNNTPAAEAASSRGGARESTSTTSSAPAHAAGEPAGTATEDSLERDDPATSPPIRAARQEDQAIVDAQEEVRNELADLIELLDRDEDSWVVKRQLETLVIDQERLQADTGSLGQRTLGRSRADLTAAERSELDAIAERQRDIQDRARQLTEELRDRAEAMRNIDQRSASGMRRAAETAEQRSLDRDMSNAAERAEQNQMRNAQQSQSSARETMQRMLDDIEESKRARAEELLRRLASLVESIERLIVLQENELNELARSQDSNDYSGRDRAMIRLHQNTLAVSEEARAAGQESRRIARSLDRAADAQSAAVAALRALPVQGERALEAEERSLALLKEAKRLAEELQQQTQEEETQRQREELIEAYRGFAERQVALRAESQPLTQVADLSRRELVEARRLGSLQEALRLEIAQLADRTREVMTSPLFAHTHRLIDSWSRTAAELLSNGSPNVDALDAQQLVADSLGRLIGALEEANAPPPEFADDSDQGSGGSQGAGGQAQQQLLPPVAHIKLLRGLQEQIYEQTRMLDARQDLAEAQQRTRLRTLGEMQRELMQLGEQMLQQLQQGMPPGPTRDRREGSDGSQEQQESEP